MNYLDVYLHLVDALRESRRSTGWNAKHDRSILAHLEDLYEKLSDVEQERVEAEGWRAWPDRYDARMRELVQQNTRDLVEVQLDAADDGPVDQLPRHSKAA